MNAFAINLVFAGVWAALAGAFTVSTLGIGFILGFAALWIARPLFAEQGYFLRAPRLLRLALFFLWAFLVSSLRVAREVLAPRPRSRPGIVAVPLRACTDLELLTLSSLVSLTPGTLALDLSEDCRTLFVHAMFVDDPDALRREIVEDFETRVLEALR